MRGSLILVLSLTLTACALETAAAGPLGMSGSDVVSPDGVAYTLYTGKIPSFDAVPLDVDLTVPQGPVMPRPLVVMMHGWGGSKTDWESATVHSSNADKDGYNNVAFVARGYAVLNYTARGFHGSCGPEAGSDPACARGWTHLADRRFEIRDTKYLVGLLADAGAVRPGRIGVTGGSYGGGQSWLLAPEADRVSVAGAADPEQVMLQPWTSPAGVRLHLAAAVPKYPWSDLVHSLQPNGRASDGVILPDGDRRQPFGIIKESWSRDSSRSVPPRRVTHRRVRIRPPTSPPGTPRGRRVSPTAPTTRPSPGQLTSSRRGSPRTNRTPSSRPTSRAARRCRCSTCRAGPTRSSPRPRRTRS